MSSARKPGSARGGGSGGGGATSSSTSSRRSKSPNASGTTAAPPSLRRAVQNRLLNDVFQACSGKSGMACHEVTGRSFARLLIPLTRLDSLPQISTLAGRF